MLVRTPEPMETESLLGYLLRVSELNGYDTPSHVLIAAGYSDKERRTAGFASAKLAAMVGRESEELEAIAYRAIRESGTSHCKILTHRLTGSLNTSPLRLTRSAFCPECVKQTGFIDAFWDLDRAIAESW